MNHPIMTHDELYVFQIFKRVDISHLGECNPVHVFDSSLSIEAYMECLFQQFLKIWVLIHLRSVIARFKLPSTKMLFQSCLIEFLLTGLLDLL